MKVEVNYYVFCFDRYLTVAVDETDKVTIEKLMDQAYYEWHDLESDDCCEEYICLRLQEHGIEFEWAA